MAALTTARRFTRLLLICGLGCSQELAHNLDETEANRVVVALLDQQIVAGKRVDPVHEGQFLVEVAESDLGSALKVLDIAGLPTRHDPGVLAALGEAGLVASPSVEQARHFVGVSGDLERSLSALDGVLSARVHIAVPETEGLGLPTQLKAPTASVLVRHRGATPTISSGDIARLVAAAVPGLEAAAVVVVLAPVPAPPQANDSLLASLGPFAVARNSASALRLVLGLAALLNVVLVIVAALLWTRAKQAAKAAKGNAEAA